MLSQTEENYLKTIFLILEEEKPLTISVLSSRIGVSMPTVNSMIKSLSGKDLIKYTKYKPIEVTKNGKLQAANIIRKHRLTEMYLAEKMGFGWEEVHAIAEQMEHINSILFFDKMDELLGFPKIDPHGSPIPNKDGIITPIIYTSLAACQNGYTVNIAAIKESSFEFLSFLNSKQLALGSVLEIIKIESYDGSIELVDKSGTKHILSKIVCEKLLVNIISGPIQD